MWLVANDLEEYAEEFSNKNIDGKQLLNLDGSRLKVQAWVLSVVSHQPCRTVTENMSYFLFLR